MTAIHTSGPIPSAVRRAAARGAILLSLAAACDIPTHVPRLEQRWVVPAQSTTIPIAEFLPAGMGVVDTDFFYFGITDRFVVTRTLAQDCPACVAANGTTVPKPAFTATATASSAIPAGIISATLLAGGALQLQVTNRYNFDALRPSATARGYAVVTVTNAGVTLGRDSVNGADFPFFPGAGLARAIPLIGTLTASAPVLVQFTLFSPAGDPVVMDASRTIEVTATVTGLHVASATVSVAAKTVSSTTTIDLSGVDESIAKRVDAGALQLDVANPFAVSGTLTVTAVPAGGAPIVRSIALVTGTSHPVVAFNQAEMQALLGHFVTLTLSGPVSSAGGGVVITPRQAVVVTSRLDLTLHTGG